MCKEISKVFLAVVNGILAVFSIICLGIGIWVAATSSVGADYMPEAHGRLNAGAIVFIIASVSCILLSICGCVGALKENKVTLIVYSIGLGLLIIIQLAVIGVVAVYGTRIGQELQGALKNVEKNSFLPYNQLHKKGNMNDSDILSLFFYRIQLSLKCCGVTNYTDITNRDTAWSRASPQFNHTSMKVPASCCQFTDEGISQLMTAMDWSDFAKYRVSGSMCPMKLQDFNTQGCYPMLLDAYKTGVVAVILFCSIFIIACIACTIMACCLISKYRQQY